MVKEKKCPKCELVKESSEFYKSKQSKSGLRSYCIKCTNAMNSSSESKYKETRKKYRENNKELIKEQKALYYQENKEMIDNKAKEYSQTLNGRYISYRNGANNRGIDFNISKEEFKTFWNKPCTYCGSEIETIGIDRIKSNEGYRLCNCIPCCSSCNMMKSDNTKDDFISNIKKIYEYLKLDKRREAK